MIEIINHHRKNFLSLFFFSFSSSFFLSSSSFSLPSNEQDSPFLHFIFSLRSSSLHFFLSGFDSCDSSRIHFLWQIRIQCCIVLRLHKKQEREREREEQEERRKKRERQERRKKKERFDHFRTKFAPMTPSELEVGADSFTLCQQWRVRKAWVRLQFSERVSEWERERMESDSNLFAFHTIIILVIHLIPFVSPFIP